VDAVVTLPFAWLDIGMEAVHIFLVSSKEDVGGREGQRSLVECVGKMVCRSLGWRVDAGECGYTHILVRKNGEAESYMRRSRKRRRKSSSYSFALLVHYDSAYQRC